MVTARPADPTAALERELRRLVRGDRCGAMAIEHLDTGGKRFRARLALAVAAAFEVRGDAALGWAAAVELLHNASLVHDDLQDGDTTRRGSPTCWVRHGAAQAINAGDLMLVAPFLALSELPAPAEVRARLVGCLARRALDIVRGQAADLALRLEDELLLEEVVRVAAAKTAGLFVLPVEGALLLAGLDPDRARAEAEVFAPLGTLYQLQDDLDDLRAAGADLRQGRVTAPIAAHLARRPEDRARLVSLRGTTPSAADLRGVVARMEASGALAEVRGRITACAAAVRGSAGDPRVLAVAEAAVAAFT